MLWEYLNPIIYIAMNLLKTNILGKRAVVNESQIRVLAMCSFKQTRYSNHAQ